MLWKHLVNEELSELIWKLQEEEEEEKNHKEQMTRQIK